MNLNLQPIDWDNVYGTKSTSNITGKTTTVPDTKKALAKSALSSPINWDNVYNPTTKPAPPEAASHAFNPANPNYQQNLDNITKGSTGTLSKIGDTANRVLPKVEDTLTGLDTPGTSAVKNFFQPSNFLDALTKTVGGVFGGIGTSAKAAVKAAQVPAGVIADGKSAKQAFKDAPTLGDYSGGIVSLFAAPKAAEQRLINNPGYSNTIAGKFDSLVAAFPNMTPELVDDYIVPAIISGKAGNELVNDRVNLKLTPEELQAKLTNGEIKTPQGQAIAQEMIRQNKPLVVEGNQPATGLKAAIGKILGGTEKPAGFTSNFDFGAQETPGQTPELTGGSAQAPSMREQLGVSDTGLAPKEAQAIPLREQLGMGTLPGAAAQAPTLRDQLQANQAPVVQSETPASSITPATPEVTQSIINTPTEAEIAQQKEDKLLSQAGSVSPGAAFADIKASIDKLKEGSKDARAGEALRTKYVGNEGARVVADNHLLDDVQKLVKNPLEQEALTLFRNFKDNLPELQQMLDGTHPAYKESIDFFKEHNPGATEADVAAFKESAIKDVQKFIKPIQLALNPSKGLLAADKAYTEFAKSHLEEGKKLGILDSTIKPENYVHQMTNPKVKPRGFTGRTSKGKIGGTLTASMERKFPTPLHAVIAGATPRTINAITTGRIYAQTYAAKAATTEFLKELSDIQLANLTGDNVPKDWESVKIGKQKIVYLPKKIADSIKPILESNTNIKVLDHLSKFQALVKAGEVSASIFHLKALGLTASNSMGSKVFSRAMIEDKDSARFREDEIDFVKSGGTTSELGKTIEAYKLVNQGTAISKFDSLKSMPGLSHVLAFSDALTYATFDIAQRKFKVNDFALQRNAYLAKNPDATPEEIFNQKVAIAKDVNATYGGLNLDVIGTSRLARAVSRILYFAPDWTYSNILKGKYVFSNKGARFNAFKFFLRSAIVTLILSQMASLLIAKQRSKHIFRVYLGNDTNGKEMYSNWFAVGAFGDWVNEFSNVADQGVIGGTVKTVGNKLASVPRTAVNQMNNKNFLGQTIRIKGASPVVNDIRSAQEAISENIPLPFGIIDSAKYAIDAQTARNFWDYAGVWLGGSTSHEIPEGNHVPTTGSQKGEVVPDKAGQGVNRNQNSLLDQIKTGKVYEATPKKTNYRGSKK